MQKEMKFGKEMPGKERETNRKPSLATTLGFFVSY